MTKVVYNACFGGFSLSTKALLRLYELGCMEVTCEATKYFSGDSDKLNEALNVWREILKNNTDVEIMDTVFSPDEKYVLMPHAHDLKRTDPRLVQVVEELGAEANGMFADLQIENILIGTQYRIDEYDGNERVMTRDSYDWETA